MRAQHRLEDLIADPAGLLAVDFLYRARKVGVRALEPLAKVVEPRASASVAA